MILSNCTNSRTVSHRTMGFVFFREALKNRYGKDHALWERSITPPQLPHGSTAAFRTDGQVNVPDRFEQFCHGQPGITLPESLAALDPEDYFQVPGFHPVIKETIVPDLLETGGEYVHQEPADKFFMANGDLPFWVTGLFPPCGEGDLCFRHGQDPVVGDGDPMGIPSQVFDRIPETVEGFFDIWTPVFRIKAVFEHLPDAGILQSIAGRRKNKFPLLIAGVQQRKIFPLKLIPEYPDRDKKLSGGSTDPVVRGKPAAGDNTVHMDMVAQFLVPGVEDLYDPGLCAKIFSVSG